jgi:hypothetical protein
VAMRVVGDVTSEVTECGGVCDVSDVTVRRG